jgi:segregation and condensation protein B
MAMIDNPRGVIEALLFVSDEPVTSVRLAKVMEIPESAVVTQLRALAEEYERDDRGFQLREVAGGWRLYTHPAFDAQVEQLVLSWDTRRLSQAALETLSVVAYNQPVTRAGINAIRGVNSEGVLASLMEKGLVRDVGRDKTAGNAILYGTTKTFLEKFGLKDLSELPELEQFAPDAETAKAISERLSGVSATRTEAALEGDAAQIETLSRSDEDADDEDLEPVEAALEDEVELEP